MQTPPPIPTDDQPAPQAAPTFAPVSFQYERVQDNHPCLKCGYNLRGLSVGAVCPECGTTIGESLKTYLLAYAPRGYVKSIHTGLTIIFIATLAFFLSSFAPLLVAFMPSLLARFMAAGNPFGILQVQGWIALVQMVPILLALVGYWLATPPDPGLSNFSRVQTPRLLTRTAIITLAVCGVLLIVVQFIVPRALAPALTAITTPGAAGGTTTTKATPTPMGTGVGAMLKLFQALPLSWMIVGIVASVLQSISWLVMFFGFVSYIRLLAPRLPDQQLTNLASTWLWLLPVIYIVGSCIMIGPVAAIAMYLLLLWMFRAKLGTLALATQSD